MHRQPIEKYTIHAQDWYEFDPDYWNPMPKRFTAYHISIEALRHHSERLHNINRAYRFLTFEEASEPYLAVVDRACYQELQARQTVRIQS
ncbi:MAG: hypothetical protein KA604_00145 [Candidatus Saccharimonas sp.]|nr:hypothetical protein [Candidatus Saccharimonas sp.]